jgi:hypothetical protein
MLQSKKLAFSDPLEAIDYYEQQGWTDGLPVVPPTPERVQAMLNAAGMSPGDIIGIIPERRRTVNAEKLAINAVMAGCRPEYMPVVLTAIRAILHPDFQFHGPTASTGGTAILTVVSGPITKQIGMNSGTNLFGPGNRANATIGRAIRLILMNVCGGREFDRSTIGHPGKYTYCIAEKELEGWTPFHVERGFERDANVVTVFAAEAPNQVNNHTALEASPLLATFASRMAAVGTFNLSGRTECAVVMCPEHIRTFLAEGWTKERVRQELYEKARRTHAEMKAAGVMLGDIQPGDHQITAGIVDGPEDIFLIAGGGEAGRFSAFIPGWGRNRNTQAVSLEIRGST